MFDGALDNDPGLAPPPRWHKPREVRIAAGLTVLTIALGWLFGQLAALVLLNERVLAALGVGP